ncbi:MAG: hypothetical protein ABIO57_01020 [Candidatus Paceibacterota bacterium]
MKNKFTIWAIIIVVIVCIACAALVKLHSDHLPSSFTITTHADFTSSGGTRLLDETYTFKNNILISGAATFFDGAGGGCQKDCNNTEQCVITDNQWVEVQKWHTCEEEFGPVPTKQSLESKITSGELVAKKSLSSTHGRYYYEVSAK